MNIKKIAITAILTAFPLVSACSDDSSSSPSTGDSATEPLAECTAPAYLKKGDKVALLSPSYSTPDSNIQKTADAIKEWGFTPVIGKNVNKLDAGKYAGTAEERADDFVKALKDTSIKAILCNRGGYGTIQLVDLIDQNLVKDNPKWLIGFSDITTLHAMQTNAGVMSIHGTMSSFIAKTGGTDDNSTLVRDLLKGEVPTYKVPKHKYNQKGSAEGILVGGNMATFVPLVGMSDIDIFTKDGIILFMEEIGESLHNIDRMFNTLELHGVLENVRGVILGEFVDSGSDLEYATTEEMLSKYLKKYDIPVICGFPAGHDDMNLPLVMGAKVKMDVTDKGATLAFDMDGEKKDVDTGKLAPKTALSKALLKMLSGKIFDIGD
ncbi:LD-carboxypeptidase [uncultured Fibrobacter sp.]|uniref:S66 peptidase family protein n=1 Tax=uncultured Fibrobacter sp. TaxID=261512 RepID=UPI00261F16CF|nr:LD-carboxypeptidase [uncultured Fibrobacter sp.]